MQNFRGDNIIERSFLPINKISIRIYKLVTL
ncbi:hypothetical protein GECvBN5_gp149c [Salmonella phage GEC_vB_N5]|uniref:Uncharacterized protein n=1 Tax=Salmonella phage GEC_vB_N5 TaxID=2777378 RepID=A0A7S9SRR9_9CAUD|nr:hypothetical protein GECvBN5_gp149c [Salmonella phage GEC_vB_N5]